MGKEKSTDAILIEIVDNEKEIGKICENTSIILEEKNRIKIPRADAIATIAYQFILETMNYLNKNKQVGKDTEINMMQLFDIGISHQTVEDGEKEGNFVPFIRPGQEFKLLVKDDSITEEDE
jgi:hypothetical protein